MLVTDQAKMIRLPLTTLRIISRGSAGVRLFNVADNEHVVSAARIEETEEDAEVNLADGDVAVEPVPDATPGDDLAAGPEDGE
jgi:DNA gyrase subunit A